MRLKILLTGKDEKQQQPDAELLSQRGFLVYRCTESMVNDMIDEIHPDVVIVNPVEKDDTTSSSLYERLLNNIKYARLPLIYTLSEDDVYLVNRKRTAVRGMRNFISDNIIDGIKTALGFNKDNLRGMPGINLGMAS